MLLPILLWERGPRVSHITGLFLITGLCGLVDAVCFLSLGEVFAEMMTGNLLLFSLYFGTGHAILQHPVYPVALGSFVVGVIAGGHIVRSAYGHTRLGFAVEWVFLALAAVLSLVLPPPSHEAVREILIALLAFAMGMQNALIRRHGVPDLATNVMTLTLAALVADSVLAGGRNERWQRRLGSIGIFMLGAGVGAALTTTIGPSGPLLLALALFSVALTGLTRQDLPPQ
ncbi:MAG TPA: YoaK family protein [Acetobacteraceae bacterium]|nr:YoaK family protein [Acetobacteraceae bacterium]